MSTRYSIEDLDRARDTAQMAGLEGAEVLHRLSDARILEACNGIGPEWMPAWARELLDKRFPAMQVPAMLHDLHYTLADGSDEAFHEANRMLGQNGPLSLRLVEPRQVSGHARCRQARRGVRGIWQDGLQPGRGRRARGCER